MTQATNWMTCVPSLKGEQCLPNLKKETYKIERLVCPPGGGSPAATSGQML